MTQRIALLPWGDAIEDFLAPLDLTLEQFRDDVSGGWLFGYVDALKAAGVETVIVCFSDGVRRTRTWRHHGTGSELLVLPVPRPGRLLRGVLDDRYAWSTRDAVRTRRPMWKPAAAAAHHLAPYLATAPGQLATALRSHRVDAVLCQEYEYPRFDVAVLLGKMIGKPVFATFQGGAARRTGIERPFRRLSTRFCDGLIIGSAAEAERVQRVHGVASERIARIPNPLDVDLWESARRRARPMPSQAGRRVVQVAWHGRVDMRRKGLDVLLDAWASLARRTDLPARELLLIGSGEDDDQLGLRLADEVFSDVEWARGYELDKRRIADRLAAADVYAFPSRHEGFPVAPLEAMASGLPLVAADVPGIAEILPLGEGSGGLIVPRDDPPAFAEGLARLISDAPLRERLAGLASRRVASSFSLEAVGHDLRRFMKLGSTGGEPHGARP